MASWGPFQKGSPLAMTSIRRSSVQELWVFRALVQIDAPASRHTRAMDRSKATPLVLNALVPEWIEGALASTGPLRESSKACEAGPKPDRTSDRLGGCGVWAGAGGDA